MANLEKTAIFFLSAALRHVRDAEHLFDPDNPGRSIDQSYHLLGYGPECARKATLSVRWFDRILGHRLGENANEILDIIISLDQWAARYHPMDWASKFPHMAAWQETCRYEKTGTRDAHDVGAAIVEARNIVDEIIGALWADGRVPGGIE